MNQKVSVRAIVKKDNKILLLRRSKGRETILSKYELPGGAVEYKEQPEDALKRYLSSDTSLSMQTTQLYDAITYIDHDNRDIQYLVIVYLVGLADSDKQIALSDKYDKYIWQKMSEIQQNEITDLSQLLLGIVKQQQLTEETFAQTSNIDVNNSSNKNIIYADGGSRGNPGQSASAFVIMDNDENILDTGGVYLGITTNNQAEYHAAYHALKRAKEMGLRSIEYRGDSSLVINQLNGIYKIKNRDLWPIHEEVVELMKTFDKVVFTHVKREFNQVADSLVNKILDEHASKV